MNNVICRSCQMENAYVDIIDSNGTNFTCPDCNHEWCDSKINIKVTEGDLVKYRECLVCGSRGNRWIFKCNECEEMIGCYDEADSTGCFTDGSNQIKCPVCGICSFEIIGLVGKGSVD